MVARSCSNCRAGRTSHRNRAGASPAFQKRWAVPGSTTTVSPGPATIVSPSATNPTSPSRISKRSVWYGWTWVVGDEAVGLDADVDEDVLAIRLGGGANDVHGLAGDGVVEDVSAADHAGLLRIDVGQGW